MTGDECPFCGSRGWFTCGGHHKDRPLGLHRHRCPVKGRTVYWCSHCGRVR